jgi:hypothetical protein
MTGDDGLESFGSRVEIERTYVMNDVEGGRLDLENGGQRERVRPGTAVIVPADCGYGCKPGKQGQNFGRANIAGVYDEVNAT